MLGGDLTFGYIAVRNATEVQLNASPFAAGGVGSIYRGRMHQSQGQYGAMIVAKELKADKVQDGFAEFQHEVH